MRSASKTALQRHLQHLRLVAVDVDVELRRAGRECSEDVLDARCLVGRRNEVVGDLLELRRVMLARFCRRMEKPVWPPMPRTGGGMVTVVFEFLDIVEARGDVSAIAIDGEPSAARLRGSSIMAKISPRLLELEPVDPERPVVGRGVGDAGRVEHQSRWRRRTTSSVRCSEAPGGNCSETVISRGPSSG